MSKVYIGIDLAAKYCWGATRNGRGELRSVERFETSEENLVAYVESQSGEATVLLEECDMAGWAQRILIPHALKVAVCEPRSNLWIHRDAVKTDKIDAKKLAAIVQMGNYKEVYHTADDAIYALHRAVRAYDRLVGRTTALKNQIKAELRGEGIIMGGTRVYGTAGRQEAMAIVTRPAVRETIAQEYELLDFLSKEQARARGRFVRLGGQVPIVRALQEIPGVGPVGAARFCAYVKCPHRFADKRKLWRYSRLGITACETGGRSIRRQHLDRAGCGALKDVSRKAFEAAMRTRGDNLVKRAYAQALESTGSEVHARLTCQRKIIATMWSMWRCGTPYDDNYDLKTRGFEARL
jgi:transposase